MEKELTEYFKDLLYKEKRSKEKFLSIDKVGLGISIKEDSGELSSYDNHPGDLGSETFEAEKNYSFRKNYKTIIKLIDNAINKIENDNYGVCEVCGKNIDIDRLKLLPYARFCIGCEKTFNKNLNDAEKGRPIEEEVLRPPFGNSFGDDEIDDNILFDGEDTWQAVKNYDDDSGYVESVESISNEKHKKQFE